MESYYNKSNFQRGPTYSLEYYRDSSLSTVLYVYFKQEGAKITKYYSIRGEKGSFKGKTVFLGNETTTAVRPGHDMPQLNYTKVNLTNTSLVNSMLTAAGKASGSVLGSSTVLELKYWQFPQGQLYLLRCENSNKSSTYFALLNSSGTLSLVGQTLIPHYISSVDLDYVYLNAWLKRFLHGVYSIDFIHSQAWLNSVIFFEMFFDPLYENSIHLMVTIDRSFRKDVFNETYGSVMAYIALSGRLLPTYIPAYVARNINITNIFLIYELNYTKISDNRFHDKSYFNNDDYDERMGNWTAVGELDRVKHAMGIGSDGQITKVFKINYVNFRLYSLELRYGVNYRYRIHIRQRVGRYDVSDQIMGDLVNTCTVANQTFNPFKQ